MLNSSALKNLLKTKHSVEDSNAGHHDADMLRRTIVETETSTAKSKQSSQSRTKKRKLRRKKPETAPVKPMQMRLATTSVFENSAIFGIGRDETEFLERHFERYVKVTKREEARIMQTIEMLGGPEQFTRESADMIYEMISLDITALKYEEICAKCTPEYTSMDDYDQAKARVVKFDLWMDAIMSCMKQQIMVGLLAESKGIVDSYYVEKASFQDNAEQAARSDNFAADGIPGFDFSPSGVATNESSAGIPPGVSSGAMPGGNNFDPKSLFDMTTVEDPVAVMDVDDYAARAADAHASIKRSNSQPAYSSAYSSEPSAFSKKRQFGGSFRYQSRQSEEDFLPPVRLKLMRLKGEKRKRLARVGFDKSITRATPRCLKHGENLFPAETDPNDFARVIAKVQDLREQLEITEEGILQLDDLVDNNIMWVKKNCDMSLLGGHLSERTVRRCQAIACERIGKVLFDYFVNSMYYAFHRWADSLKVFNLEISAKKFSQAKAIEILSRTLDAAVYRQYEKGWEPLLQNTRRQRRWEREAAATEINRVARGKLGRILARKVYFGFRATVIQCLVRRHLAKLKRVRMEREKRFWKFFHAANTVARLFKKAVYARKEVERKELEFKSRNATQIQRVYRGRLGRRRFTLLKKIAMMKKKKEDEARLKAEYYAEQKRLAEEARRKAEREKQMKQRQRMNEEKEKQKAQREKERLERQRKLAEKKAKGDEGRKSYRKAAKKSDHNALLARLIGKTLESQEGHKIDEVDEGTAGAEGDDDDASVSSRGSRVSSISAVSEASGVSRASRTSAKSAQSRKSVKSLSMKSPRGSKAPPGFDDASRRSAKNSSLVPPVKPSDMASVKSVGRGSMRGSGLHADEKLKMSNRSPRPATREEATVLISEYLRDKEGKGLEGDEDYRKRRSIASRETGRGSLVAKTEAAKKIQGLVRQRSDLLKAQQNGAQMTHQEERNSSVQPRLSRPSRLSTFAELDEHAKRIQELATRRITELMEPTAPPPVEDDAGSSVTPRAQIEFSDEASLRSLQEGSLTGRSLSATPMGASQDTGDGQRDNVVVDSSVADNADIEKATAATKIQSVVRGRSTRNVTKGAPQTGAPQTGRASLESDLRTSGISGADLPSFVNQSLPSPTYEDGKRPDDFLAADNDSLISDITCEKGGSSKEFKGDNHAAPQEAPVLSPVQDESPPATPAIDVEKRTSSGHESPIHSPVGSVAESTPSRAGSRLSKRTSLKEMFGFGKKSPSPERSRGGSPDRSGPNSPKSRNSSLGKMFGSVKSLLSPRSSAAGSRPESPEGEADSPRAAARIAEEVSADLVSQDTGPEGAQQTDMANSLAIVTLEERPDLEKPINYSEADRVAATVRIQAQLRRYICKVRMILLRRAEIESQRRAGQLLRWAIVTIQRTGRGYIAKKRFIEERSKADFAGSYRGQLAATKIQSVIRGFLDRNMAEDMKYQEEEMRIYKEWERKKNDPNTTQPMPKIPSRTSSRASRRERIKAMSAKVSSPTAASAALEKSPRRSFTTPSPKTASPPKGAPANTISDKPQVGLSGASRDLLAQRRPSISRRPSGQMSGKGFEPMRRPSIERRPSDGHPSRRPSLDRRPSFERQPSKRFSKEHISLGDPATNVHAKELEDRIKRLEEIEKNIADREQKMLESAQLAEQKAQEMMSAMKDMEERQKKEAEDAAQRNYLLSMAAGPMDTMNSAMNTRRGSGIFRTGGSTASRYSTMSSARWPAGKPGTSRKANAPIAASAPRMFYNGAEWVQLWDETYQAAYWYNENSGESTWWQPGTEPEYDENYYSSDGNITDYSTEYESGKEYSGSEAGEGDLTGWQEYWDEQAQAKYWYNYETGEATWTKPESAGGVLALTNGSSKKSIIASSKAGSAQGTLNSQLTIGAGDDWVSYLDEATGQEYWYNTKTGESSWA